MDESERVRTTHVCTHVDTQVYTQVYTHVCTHVYSHVYTHVCTHINAHHTRLSACIYSCLPLVRIMIALAYVVMAYMIMAYVVMVHIVMRGPAARKATNCKESEPRGPGRFSLSKLVKRS